MLREYPKKTSNYFAVRAVVNVYTGTVVMSSPQSLAHSAGSTIPGIPAISGLTGVHGIQGANPQFDFVGSDFEALASHMRQCAASQGRWDALRSNLQRVHSVAAGRIVTVACIATVVGISLIAFA